MSAFVFDSMTYRGYGAKPLPDALDFEVLNSLIDAKLNDKGKVSISQSRTADSVLEAFAERAASLAVRTKEDLWIRNGVAALCVTSAVSDRREAEIVLCLLHDAAKRLGLSPREIFSVGIFLKRDLIESFLSRDEEDKSLSAMGYVAGADEDGFRYVRSW
ncbi:MAG: hypothetical protein ACOY33_00990 [Pseudomonadota bacterium]